MRRGSVFAAVAWAIAAVDSPAATTGIIALINAIKLVDVPRTREVPFMLFLLPSLFAAPGGFVFGRHLREEAIY